MNYIESKLEETMINLYLIYVNDYLTVEKFAKDHNLTIRGANLVIREGRELLNNARSK